jgi:hypothetical protein
MAVSELALDSLRARVIALLTAAERNRGARRRPRRPAADASGEPGRAPADGRDTTERKRLRIPWSAGT